MSIDKNTPLGLALRYDPQTQQTVVTWSYIEDSDIQYFELQVWDTDKRKWVPYDGLYGIVKKD